MVIPTVTEQPRHLESVSADPFLGSSQDPRADAAVVRELDHRHADGIDVRLLWDPSDDRVWVSVFDSRSGDAFEIQADPARTLDVFRHPFAYAAGPSSSSSSERVRA